MTKGPDHGGRIAQYLELRASHPAWFVEREGGVRIVADREGIRAVEREMGDRYAARGWPRDWAEVGVQYRDPYLVVLRDAVIFPNGDAGVHHRAVRMEGEPSGVAVLPLYEGRVLLIKHFRHPVRAWCWEIPRGAVEPGESAEEAVHVELAEEIGAAASEVVPIGAIHGASGFMGHCVRLFFARLTRHGEPARGEGIVAGRLVTPDELEAMIATEEVTDSYTLAAYLQARLRGLV